ncbi:MAG TPA: hypothetical protein PKY82_27825, partial [Pyrinomonadaceae bacterium]|nr:hypothetical protein [Pyrinomonadaceae bacterium]
MTKHLSNEQLNLLQTHKLRGSSFVEALRHIEGCEHCRNKIPKSSVQEVLQSIFGEESAPIQNQPEPSLIPSLRGFLVPLSVGLLLILLGSAIILFFNSTLQNQNNIAQTKNNVNSITPIISATIEPQPTQTAANSTKNESVKQKFENTAQNFTNQKDKPHRVLTKPSQTVASLKTNISKAKLVKSNLSKRVINEVAQNPKVRFVWAKIQDAANYEITIFDKTYNEVARQTVQTNSFQFTDPLEKEKSYFWKLVAYNVYGEPISTKNSGNVGAFQIKNLKLAQQTKRLGKTNQNDL